MIKGSVPPPPPHGLICQADLALLEGPRPAGVLVNVAVPAGGSLVERIEARSWSVHGGPELALGGLSTH